MGEVDGGMTLDGGAARARGAAREGAGCGDTALEKATVGGPCNGQGERRFCRSRESSAE